MADFDRWLAALPAHAAVAGDASIDWLSLGMGLFGGLALFLAGLEILSEGMKQAAGETLKQVLSQLTANRFLGALTGAFVTGVLNSSSVTTLLVVGFVSATVRAIRDDDKAAAEEVMSLNTVIKRLTDEMLVREVYLGLIDASNEKFKNS